MPIIKSAIKRVRVAERKTKKNRIVKTQAKETLRQFLDLLKDGKAADAAKMFPIVQKAIDMMAKKNIWHKSKASRKKARLARLLKEAGANPATTKAKKTAAPSAEAKAPAAKKPATKKAPAKKAAPKKAEK